MSGIITNIDELDKLKKSQYKTITKISLCYLANTDFVKLKNIAKLSNLIELDLSTNPELFNIVDDKVYHDLIQQYDTLKKSDILSNNFLEHRTTFLNAVDKCQIDITKPIKKQIIKKINDIKITNQYKQLFFTNQSIKILSLNYNQLTTLSTKIDNLINITSLILSNNKLRTLPKEIGKLINITSLSLYNNQLTTLPKEIGNLINITDLDLSNNQLTTLPETLGKLINISSLSLSNNQLTTLPETLGNLINITSLSLYNNQLITLPETLGNLINITKLDLSKNRLSGKIGGLINITELDLSNNKLLTLPEEIGKLINITKLDLSNNQLSELSEEICNLINLKDLDLSYNKLSELPEEICKLINITKLDLSNNELSKLSEALGKLINITNLICRFDIDNNDTYDNNYTYYDIDKLKDYNEYDSIPDELNIEIEDFESYCDKKCEDDWDDSSQANRDLDDYYDYCDWWEENKDKDDIWEEYIDDNIDKINEAIKEYTENYFNEYICIKKVSFCIFMLPNINEISFYCKSKKLNSILENILDDDTRIELNDFLQDLNVAIPFSITITKKNNKDNDEDNNHIWNIKIEQFITEESIELTSINMVDYNSESD